MEIVKIKEETSVSIDCNSNTLMCSIDKNKVEAFIGLHNKGDHYVMLIDDTGLSIIEASEALDLDMESIISDDNITVYICLPFDTTKSMLRFASVNGISDNTAQEECLKFIEKKINERKRYILSVH
ncbi:hypothetical protein FVR03_21690 [Pontibacter qinzhouensis]|uniref:Uncharacterized protein n=1 Tax=Pontibacter qinzhouensis TaxID=2603253 RepID=A0A5C8IYB1_9BACT|nr:hypothetical protein [Pontibacter qinzhouensis]TXK26538.1 hypothetical protein FVR03_21690 [Pontibacter qinzhouensis]